MCGDVLSGVGRESGGCILSRFIVYMCEIFRVNENIMKKK